MSKDSQRVEKWKRIASEGLGGYHRQLLEKIVDEGVKHRHFTLDELPTEVMYRDRHCKLVCEYEIGKEYPYTVKYVDVENNESVLTNSGKTWDDAICYTLIRVIDHCTVRDMDGNMLRLVHLGICNNKEEFEIIEKRYKVRPMKKHGFGLCPYCDSDNVSSQHFRSDPESWMVLAGREGYNYECKDCGYKWEEITCMS